MPENQDSAQLSSKNTKTVNENILEIDEEISLFQDDDEEKNADDKKDLHENANQTSRKSFIGGLSAEKFFASSHNLNSHSNVVGYLWLKKLYLCSQSTIKQ